jgi:hypothetical protein
MEKGKLFWKSKYEEGQKQFDELKALKPGKLYVFLIKRARKNRVPNASRFGA